MSKGTDKMGEVIKAFLDDLAARDEGFALSYENPKKSIEECVNYIIGEVQKSGKQGFDDSEIYGMAVHYYDEEDLGSIKSAGSGTVVVNHAIELTPDEVEAAKQKAVEQIAAEQVRKIKEKERREKEAAKQKAEEARKAAEAEGLFSLFGEEES